MISNYYELRVLCSLYYTREYYDTGVLQIVTCTNTGTMLDTIQGTHE